ncbi:hypothetical protein GALL_105880 [mine drainage metagenome]|uniref:Class I SAM-dependent methyltransferase n=1 Tax=mine drainage metagenome TaxID=410659 RepID=A0A1J5T0F6_9ZZZZ
MNLRLLKHELHVAWRRYRLRTIEFNSGLGDAGWLLHGLVRTMKPETCVEIGSARGHSTCLLGLALKLNLRGRLWAVDPHFQNAWSDKVAEDTQATLSSNLAAAGVTDYVTIVRKTTRDAESSLPIRIDFAFIDGDHSYEGVKTDWEILKPRMAPFGVVVFHDTLWDRNRDEELYKSYRRENMGVPKLLEELRLEGYPIVTINQNWGISMLQLPKGGESFLPSKG